MKKYTLFLAVCAALLMVFTMVNAAQAGQASAYASIVIIIPQKDAQASETVIAQQQAQPQTQQVTSEDATAPEMQELAYAQTRN
jgi:P pilus assembly chaperone PapD